MCSRDVPLLIGLLARYYSDERTKMAPSQFNGLATFNPLILEVLHVNVITLMRCIEKRGQSFGFCSNCRCFGRPGTFSSILVLGRRYSFRSCLWREQVIGVFGLDGSSSCMLLRCTNHLYMMHSLLVAESRARLQSIGYTQYLDKSFQARKVQDMSPLPIPGHCTVVPRSIYGGQAIRAFGTIHSSIVHPPHPPCEDNA